MQPLLIIYFILTSVISVIGTLYAPAIVAHIKRYYNGIKHKRQTAFRTAVRNEVREYLEELKK